MTLRPTDVDLLIFDLDGTLHSGIEPQLEAMRRAFPKFGLDVRITHDEIAKYFGLPSDEFWRQVTPEERLSVWQEIRNATRQEYPSSLRDFAVPFPSVVETLKTLRARGYKLALYSNSSVAWFNAAISALGIREHFDYLECLDDNNLSKPNLVRKIRNKFGNPVAAVVGDRIHDIEAARENQALSVGVLYGYGGEETAAADVTIGAFTDLLGIFDRRLAIFEIMLLDIKKAKKSDRAFIIGVSGIDASGKTKFADALAAFLASNSYTTQLVHLDDFHNPKKLRYSGESEAENYYTRQFDLNTLVEKLLKPIEHSFGKYSQKLTLLDLMTDQYTVEKEYTIDKDTIIVLEGIFLFKDVLAPYIDFKIFLDVPFEESMKRAEARDIPIFGPSIMDKYNNKYFPAERRYLAEFPPELTSDMVVDNSNWNYPKVRFVR